MVVCAPGARQFEQALAAIDEPSSYGVRWTKDGLVDLLRDVFRPGSRFESEYGARCSQIQMVRRNRPSFLRRTDAGASG
jgi:hypothetical protein